MLDPELLRSEDENEHEDDPAIPFGPKLAPSYCGAMEVKGAM